MLYYAYEAQRTALLPLRFAVQTARSVADLSHGPLAETPIGQLSSAIIDMLDYATKRYGKPAWEISDTEIDGEPVRVTVDTMIRMPFCDLVHFNRHTEKPRNDPRLLIVAPLSGHFATLLRGTVQGLLPTHDVYITDWTDARMVPLHTGNFSYDDYVGYVIDFLHYLGPNVHVLAVCQPAVPVFAATAIMSGWGDSCAPATLTLIGGPIDTRKNPTEVNRMAMGHDIDWFEENVITMVPPPYPGMGRRVYPGFIQLTNFISMNLDRHIEAHWELFDHLVKGDDESADRRLSFYEEYRSVMDLPADFYLETVRLVFQEHALPNGEMKVRWQPVNPERITRTPILCIEGEFDDICGVGQTKAALEITPNLSDDLKFYHMQEDVGHYGVFNGSKFRASVVPKIIELTHRYDRETGTERRRPIVSLWAGADRRHLSGRVWTQQDRRGSRPHAGSAADQRRDVVAASDGVQGADVAQLQVFEPISSGSKLSPLIAAKPVATTSSAVTTSKGSKNKKSRKRTR